MVENKKTAEVKTRELLVRQKGSSILFEVYVEDGGVVPSVLSGEYTSEHVAKKAINEYISKRTK